MGQRRREMLNTELGLTAFTRRHTRPSLLLALLAAFLQMARVQFFWDVNKRMGRFMMNGILLHAGYPVINVPVRKQLEIELKMLGVKVELAENGEQALVLSPEAGTVDAALVVKSSNVGK